MVAYDGVHPPVSAVEEAMGECHMPVPAALLMLPRELLLVMLSCLGC